MTLSRVVVVGVLLMMSIFASPAAGSDTDRDIPNVLVTDKRLDSPDELLGSKIPLPASDVPVSAERIDADVIARTGFNELGPLLQAMTSTVATPTEGGAFNDFALRGFAETPVYRNGINDSLGQTPTRSLANVALIEVLKGPYGALYGPGEPGGSINFVTKKPAPVAATDLAIGFGSYGEFDLRLDSTRSLAPSANVDYRFIAEREQSDSFRDFVKRERLFVNPMLAWRPAADLRFDAAFEYITDKRLLDSGVVAVEGEFPLADDQFLGEPSSGVAQIDGYTFQAATLFQMRPDWQLDLSINGQKTRLEGDGAEPDETALAAGGMILKRSATRRAELLHVLVAQAEVSGTKPGFGVPHHLLLGISATGVNEDVTFLASDPGANAFAIDLFAPLYGQAPPLPELERESHDQTRQLSVYAQDLLRVGERWRVLLGLRYDHIEQSGSDLVSRSRFDKSLDELSPRFGIVFKPSPAWSWFTSYSGSIDPNEGLQPNGSGLDPTESEAVEAGIKWHSSSASVAVNASVFAIRQTNVTTDAPGNPGFEIQSAEQESLGADFEFRADPRPWLSVTARYSFIEAQIINDPVISNGTTPLNVAKHQMGALAFIRSSILNPDDLSIGMSLNYLSDRQGSLEPTELDLKLPDYFRGDVFISWTHSRALWLDFGIENFTDENYIRGSQSDGLHLTPGTPLTVRGRITWSF